MVKQARKKDGIEALLPPALIKSPGAYQAFLLQPAQGPINGGQVDCGIALADHAEDLLGGGVAAQAVQSFQYFPPLGSHPPALGVQPLGSKINESFHKSP